MNLIDTKTSTLEYEADYLSEEKASILMDRCKSLKLHKNPTFVAYGKTNTMHRSIGFFSDESAGYKYSGKVTTFT